MATKQARDAEARALARADAAAVLLRVRGLSIEDVDLLTEALGRLPFRSRHLILLRSGLRDGEVHTLREMGNVWGITRERVRVIIVHAIWRFLAEPRVKAAWRRVEQTLGRPMPPNVAFDYRDSEQRRARRLAMRRSSPASPAYQPCSEGRKRP